MATQKNFVIRHGLEVSDNLIVADAETENVGIGSTTPKLKLDVRGAIGCTDLSVSGVSTISILGISTATITNLSGTIGTITTLNSTDATITNLSGTIGTIATFESTDSTIENLSYISGIGTNLNVTGIATFNAIQIDGLLAAGASLGAEDQYLRHTGTGVTWVSVQRSVVETDSQTATEGQDVFNTDYTVNLVEVYLNGIRLNSNEFTATDGSTITLGTPAYDGDTLDFVKYNPFNEYPTFFWLSAAGEEIYYMDNVGIGTTNPAEKLQVEGAVRASDGFISVGNTTPIQISLVGNQLTFTASGIGSTTFTLF
jgi:hypothetical protein